MSVPLITTKLHIPTPPPELVPRPHLIAALDAGLHQKLVLVSAPAGFGKSALLAEWAAHHSGKKLVSWVHLERHDNELIRFFTYLIAGLQTHHRDIGQAALAGLQAIPPISIEAALATLINELDAVPDRWILVLDDYHHIGESAVHRAVEFLIEHLPAHVCLVLATRADPPFALHRLRAQGQMTELRAPALRFTPEETRRFLTANLDYQFASNDLVALETRIEGWVAGLQMMALSLKGRTDVGKFIKSFSSSHRYIMDYLTEEIYTRQPPELQAFLLKTSVLERLSGPLCDYVLADDPMEPALQPSQQILEALERANLFLLPLDEERVWYRYHHLFAGLLRHRLHQAAAGETTRLLGRASQWAADNGSYEEAFQYALSAGDPQAAAQVVEKQGLEYLKRGAISTILSWFEQLPEEIISDSPKLNVIYAWGLLLAGKAVDLEAYLEPAEEKLASTGEEGELQGEIAAIRAYAAARRGDIFQTLTQADTALALLPPEDASIRSVVSFVVGGVHFMQGDISAAYSAMAAAGQDGSRSGNIHVAVSAYNAMAGILVGEGSLKEAEEIYTRALKLGTTASGQPLPITASIYEGIARLHLARGDLPAAREYAETGYALSEKWANPDNQVHCLLALAEIARLEGDQAAADLALDRIRQLAATHVLMPDTEAALGQMAGAQQPSAAAAAPAAALIDPLSERELEVLRLIAAGRSNQEIAESLIIALGTVKAHTSSIYRKLDARGRTDAVVKAQTWGLL